jgi:hypothetical protein
MRKIKNRKDPNRIPPNRIPNTLVATWPTSGFLVQYRVKNAKGIKIVRMKQIYQSISACLSPSALKSAVNNKRVKDTIPIIEEINARC